MDTIDLKQRLAENVRAERTHRGLTKAAFCLEARISRPLLDKVEGGDANVTLERLGRMAGALGLEAWQLLK